MKRSIFAVLLIAVLVSIPVFGKDTWIEVKSKNFHLIGNASEKNIRKVAVTLEQFRDVLSRLFPNAKLNSPVPMRVLVFKDKKAYMPYMPSYQGKVNEVAGYFLAGTDVTYITLMPPELDDETPLSTIYHEYVHLITNDNTAQMPLWFREGLAEFYSTFEITDGGKKAAIGKHVNHHIFNLRDNKPMPLQRLFAVGHDDPEYNERDKQSVFYSQSWALVHYLMMDVKANRRPQLLKFLQLLAGSIPSNQAFKEAFQTDYAVIEKELHNYINRNSYQYQIFPFEKKLEFDTTMQSRPASEAEWYYYLGDLTYHMQRSDSEELLNKAIKLEPNLAGAHASLGMLYFNTRRLEEAKKSLERALTAGSDQYLVHFYSAFILSRQGMDESNLVRSYSDETAAAMRKHLMKAIELNPSYAESYSMLAFVSMVTGENLDEAETMLKKAMTLAIGRSDFQFKLAQIYMRQNKYDEALVLASNLSKNSEKPDIRENSKHLVEAIQRIKSYSEEREKRTLVVKPLESSTAITDSDDKEEEISTERPKLKRIEEKIEGNKSTGVLTEIQCRHDGVTFIIKDDKDKLLKFHTKKPETVKFTSYSRDSASDSEIKCGKLQTPKSVIVASKPTGEPTNIIFVKN